MGGAQPQPVTAKPPAVGLPTITKGSNPPLPCFSVFQQPALVLTHTAALTTVLTVPVLVANFLLPLDSFSCTAAAAPGCHHRSPVQPKKLYYYYSSTGGAVAGRRLWRGPTAHKGRARVAAADSSSCRSSAPAAQRAYLPGRHPLRTARRGSYYAAAAAAAPRSLAHPPHEQ